MRSDAAFTMRLGTLVEQGYDLGLRDYPIFDESHREELNTKIIDHYWNYEIGQETFELFRHALNRKMREIMPLYNQFYETERTKFDPFTTSEYSETVTHSNTARSESESTAKGESVSDVESASRAVSSETPQLMLRGDDDYATGASDAHSDTKTTAVSDNAARDVGTSAGEGESARESRGSSGSRASLIQEWRAILLNIDMLVVDELKTLFMLLWDSGDSFTGIGGHGFYGFAHGFSH